MGKQNKNNQEIRCLQLKTEKKVGHRHLKVDREVRGVRKYRQHFIPCA